MTGGVKTFRQDFVFVRGRQYCVLHPCPPMTSTYKLIIHITLVCKRNTLIVLTNQSHMSWLVPIEYQHTVTNSTGRIIHSVCHSNYTSTHHTGIVVGPIREAAGEPRRALQLSDLLGHEHTPTAHCLLSVGKLHTLFGAVTFGRTRMAPARCQAVSNQNATAYCPHLRLRRYRCR